MWNGGGGKQEGELESKEEEMGKGKDDSKAKGKGEWKGRGRGMRRGEGKMGVEWKGLREIGRGKIKKRECEVESKRI